MSNELLFPGDSVKGFGVRFRGTTVKSILLTESFLSSLRDGTSYAHIENWIFQASDTRNHIPARLLQRI
jgi:hypothetical protein